MIAQMKTDKPPVRQVCGVAQRLYAFLIVGGWLYSTVSRQNTKKDCNSWGVCGVQLKSTDIMGPEGCNGNFYDYFTIPDLDG